MMTIKLFLQLSLLMESLAFYPIAGTGRHVDSRYLHSTKLLLSSSSSLSNDQEYWSWMDEAVLLYSVINFTSFSTDESLSKELQQYRKREVTSWLEDIILTKNKSRDSEANLSSKVVLASDTPTLMLLSSNLSLEQLSQLLDKTILEGYQVDFSEEALDAWTKQIEQIQQMMEYKLKESTASSGMDGSTTNAIAKKDSSQHDLRTRLLQLQSLVPPPKSWYTPIGNTKPMKQDNGKNHSTITDNTTAASIDMGQEQVPDNASNDQNPPLETIQRGSTVNGLISNIQPSMTLEETKNTSSNDTSSLPGPGKEISLKVDTIEIPPEVTPRTMRNSSRDIASSLDGALSTGTTRMSQDDDDDVDDTHHGNNNKDKTPTQALSVQESSPLRNVTPAVLSAAAVGALAITKIPFFAAGIAMASVMKQTIDSAKASFLTGPVPTEGTSNASNSTPAIEG